MPKRRTFKDRVILFIATAAYTGYAPKAPGTVGTLWGVVIAYFMCGLGVVPQALIILGVLALSIYTAGEAAKIFDQKDPSRVTIDEVSGVLFAFFLVPFTPINAIFVFLLFRIFDILKPWPASKLDRDLGGGAGIVLDDVASGIYVNIIAHILLRFVL